MKITLEAAEAFDLLDTYVPVNLRHGIQKYIEHGIPPGNFLEAVLCNDLKGACFSGDPFTVKYLPTLVRWLWNYAPLNCHGADHKVRTWIEINKMDAMEAKEIGS